MSLTELLFAINSLFVEVNTSCEFSSNCASIISSHTRQPSISFGMSSILSDFLSYEDCYSTSNYSAFGSKF